MATYLIRESRLFAKYDSCTAVAMTGQVAAYGSVTGNATTNVVTIPGLTPINGMGITITNLAGGSGVTTGVKYFAINSTGSTCKLAQSQGGTAVALGTAITSATTVIVQTDELLVWSTEYRDIFTGLGIQGGAYAGSYGGISYKASLGAPQGYGIYADPNQPITGGIITDGGVLLGEPKATVSDEVGHASLRQSLLARTYWKFTMSTGPTPLYAEVLEGDIISNTAPNTP